MGINLCSGVPPLSIKMGKPEMFHTSQAFLLEETARRRSAFLWYDFGLFDPNPHPVGKVHSKASVSGKCFDPLAELLYVFFNQFRPLFEDHL